jgi:hypothetical protein
MGTVLGVAPRSVSLGGSDGFIAGGLSAFAREEIAKTFRRNAS